MPTLKPIFANSTEILDAIVDLPTPPFPEEIAIIEVMSLIFGLVFNDSVFDLSIDTLIFILAFL